MWSVFGGGRESLMTLIHKTRERKNYSYDQQNNILSKNSSLPSLSKREGTGTVLNQYQIEEKLTSNKVNRFSRAQPSFDSRAIMGKRRSLGEITANQSIQFSSLSSIEAQTESLRKQDRNLRNIRIKPVSHLIATGHETEQSIDMESRKTSLSMNKPRKVIVGSTNLLGPNEPRLIPIYKGSIKPRMP